MRVESGAKGDIKLLRHFLDSSRQCYFTNSVHTFFIFQDNLHVKLLEIRVSGFLWKKMLKIKALLEKKRNYYFYMNSNKYKFLNYKESLEFRVQSFTTISCYRLGKKIISSSTSGKFTYSKNMDRNSNVIISIINN